MGLEEYLPIWKQLTKEDQQALENAAVFRSVPKGTIIHNGSADCIGVLVIKGGQLRSYIVSDEGKEVTLSIAGSRHPLAVGTVQAFLDAWMAAHPTTTLDYVHGEAAARTLAQQPNTVAFLLPAMDKAALLPAVQQLGALPRKTFSMGEAHQKRYYMEARALA